MLNLYKLHGRGREEFHKEYKEFGLHGIVWIQLKNYGFSKVLFLSSFVYNIFRFAIICVIYLFVELIQGGGFGCIYFKTILLMVLTFKTNLCHFFEKWNWFLFSILPLGKHSFLNLHKVD